ncbi:MAG: virulence protein RhuM/Fic/DOC family protein [Candidatus Onthomorpha sp.]|nr:virulence protein RhuM/Fic/DOC family protein [Candidatus Onthomorpha sp.]
MEEDKIIIYQTEDGQTQIDVRLENETVWLTQAQMAELFDKDRTVIGRHIRNIYKEEELEQNITCAKFAHMGSEGDQRYEYTAYNLDVIISVGYRVNSKRGVKFRQWANRVLKEYLIKGYAVNDRIRKEQIGELRQLVGMIGRTIQNKPLLSNDETNALFEVVTNYTYALDTLDNYDYERLTIDKTTKEELFHATYENAMEAINGLREKFGGSALFGNEKDDSFKSSISQIYQTFGGEELYPSVEEKAAMLLYLVTKNHSFSDGNKRIAATLFLWFLNNNHILYREDGSKRLADNTLVALTLMIAESKTEEKDVMVKVVVNLINQRNE